MSERTYITTSIPYVNARPHLGFALELVQADALARYRKLIGEEVRLQSGTDENSLKNVLAAQEAGVATEDLVAGHSGVFRELCEALDISLDSFVRTSQGFHSRCVHAFWKRLKREDVYTGTYEGLYCVGCEDFLQEKDLVDGRCPDHGPAVQRIKESNHFFRLSSYQRDLDALLASGRLQILPDTRRDEVQRFVRDGLRDFSVSRPVERSGGWGIPVPGDPSQVVYVWVDALTNYLSGLGYGTEQGWDRTWSGDVQKIHVIGKNIWKFHAVYWPALLLSAGLDLPDVLLVHGFLTEGGSKISKSRGRTLDPLDCVRQFGSDGVRHYLLRAVSPWGDGDVSTDRLREVYNSDLANDLGNLVSRLTKLAVKAKHDGLCLPPRPPGPEGYNEAWERYDFQKALESLWRVIAAQNREIDQAKPWEKISSGNEQDLKPDLDRWLCGLHAVAYWLQPFLPTGSIRILEALSARPLVQPPAIYPRLR